MDVNGMDEFITAMRAEYARARVEFREFHSPHEAYGVLAEEMAEYFDEVRRWPDRSHIASRRELVQIAAMAMAAALEVHS